MLAGKTVPLWDGAAAVRLVTTAVPLADDKTEDDFPAAAYGPDGTLWVAYIAYTDRDDSRRIEQTNFKEQPENFKALYTPEFADQLFVKYYREGKWSEPIAVTEANEDLMRCAIAVQGDGVVWVIYSAHRKGRFDIYARGLTPNFAAGGKDAVKVEAEQQWTSIAEVGRQPQPGGLHGPGRARVRSASSNGPTRASPNMAETPMRRRASRPDSDDQPVA